MITISVITQSILIMKLKIRLKMITTKYQQKVNKKLTTSIINITQIKRKIPNYQHPKNSKRNLNNFTINSNKKKKKKQHK